MPRRGKVPKRDILPDPVYGSKVVAKLINQIMLDGEKSVAQRIVYDAFSFMGEKMNMSRSDPNAVRRSRSAGSSSTRGREASAR